MFKRFIASVMMCVMLVGVLVMPVSAASSPSVDMAGIRSFVTRMYDVCLGRRPDTNGLNDWSDRLANKQATGCSVAYGFVFSNEFQSRGCSNEDYVRYMYSAFFGRQPDQAGLNSWVNALNNGTTRENVFCGFANSEEFGNLCASYGVVRGYHMEGEDAGRIAKVNLFVERLYNEVLDRSCDNGGMQGWTTQLVNHANSGCEAAYGFVFSDEFINKHLCNAHYLDVLYRAFMGRDADIAGKAAWKAQLDNGVSREEVFNGFAGSQEFIGICQSYEIDSGSITLPENGTHATGVCSICGTAAPSVPSGNGGSNGSGAGSAGSGSGSAGTPSTPTATPTPAPKHQIGEIIPMGTYHGMNLSWRIVDYKDGNYLLMLYRGAYTECVYRSNKRQWEDSFFRSTCNSIYWSFTSEQRARVVPTTNRPDSYFGNDRVDDYTTDDRIFLLSSNEVLSVFPTRQSRIDNFAQKIWVRDAIGPNSMEHFVNGDPWSITVADDDSKLEEAVFRPVMWYDLDSEVPTREPEYRNNVGDVISLGNDNSYKWQIVSRDGDECVVIATNGIYAVPFDPDGNNDYSTSYVHNWLNTDYLESNFSSTMQERIISIDLPSIELLNSIYSSQSEWKVKPTRNAIDSGAWRNSSGYTWYWLSDPCSEAGKAYYATSAGGYKTYDVKDATACVRPVMRVILG